MTEKPKYYDTIKLSSYRLWQIVELIEDRQAKGYRLLSLVQLSGDSGYFAVMEKEMAE